MTDNSVRGRPKGTGKKDGAHLAKIADIMVARKMKMPTTAMRAYLRENNLARLGSDETLIRRWQGKWKQDGEAFLQAARQRAEPVARTGTGPVSHRTLLDEFASGNISLRLMELSRSALAERMLKPSFVEEMLARQRAMDALLESSSVQKTLDAVTGINRMYEKLNKFR